MAGPTINKPHGDISPWTSVSGDLVHRYTHKTVVYKSTGKDGAERSIPQKDLSVDPSRFIGLATAELVARVATTILFGILSLPFRFIDSDLTNRITNKMDDAGYKGLKVTSYALSFSIKASVAYYFLGAMQINPWENDFHRQVEKLGAFEKPKKSIPAETA